MRKVLVLLVILSLLVSVVACSSENDVGKYLNKTSPILRESQKISLEIAKASQNPSQFNTTITISKLSDYEERLSETLTEFKNIDCPSECRYYRNYCIDHLTSSRLGLEQVRMYMTTNNETYLVNANSYLISADDASFSAADEWDKLADEAEGGTYIPIWLIVLGVMFGLPLASSIIYFAFLIVFIPIYGGFLGIWTGIKKVLGR